MTFAIVKVFPLPVTPKSVWCRRPLSNPCSSFLIACGWSPAGWNGRCNLKLAIVVANEVCTIGVKTSIEDSFAGASDEVKNEFHVVHRGDDSAEHLARAEQVRHIRACESRCDGFRKPIIRYRREIGAILFVFEVNETVLCVD